MVRSARQIKVSFCTFREDGGGERSIRFAELDFGVDDIFHLRISRVSEDAAIPQGAGPPLEASLEPAHHLPLHQVLHDLVQQFVVSCDETMPNVVLFQECADFCRRVGKAPIGVIHPESARPTQQCVVSPQRCPQGAATITSSGLDK